MSPTKPSHSYCFLMADGAGSGIREQRKITQKLRTAPPLGIDRSKSTILTDWDLGEYLLGGNRCRAF